jgi:glycosyltransferase involved in cell wall biosynthesis
MPEPIRVLHVLEATTGGTRRHVLDVLQHMDRSSFAPSLACALKRDPTFAGDVDRLRSEGIPVHVIPMDRAIRPAGDAAAFARLTRLMRRTTPDIVHTHSSKAGMLGRLAARAAGVERIVHTAHVFPFLMEAGAMQRRLYLALERLAARATARLICVCEHERKAAVAARLLPAQQVDVIWNGVDTAEIERAAAGSDRGRVREQLGAGPGHLLVGFVGRLTRQKAPLDFVRVAAQVAAVVPESRFAIIGDGELGEATGAAIRAAGLDGRVARPGRVEDVYPMVAALDLLVLTSHWEGLPYSILEAMALGRAVAATAVGGVPEVVIPGETGIVAEAGDVDLMARGIVSLLADRDGRERLGAAGRRRVGALFTRRAMLDRLQAVYAAARSRA